MDDIVLRIGGKAGTGLVTATNILTTIALKSGYQIFSSKDYASQIRGGHNYHTIRISKENVDADSNEIDILIAFDQLTLDKHIGSVKEKGIVLINENIKFEETNEINFVKINILEIENKLNQKNLHNAIFSGAAVKILGFQWEICETVINNHFNHKKELLRLFREASLLGYNQAKVFFEYSSQNTDENLSLISGNDAISLGALKAGLTFHVQYPMTPVTGILHYLEKESAKNKKITVIQPEDEIAAINMALGASYSGARAMTATSGGGFALMIESVGLAGMAEVPLVIIEGQRPGPSTGLPTKTEQGDLKFVVNAGTGDFPLAVIAPSTIEECYTETKRAFYFAEKYQLPVIVLVDKHLTESFKSTDLSTEEKEFTFDYNKRINIITKINDTQLNEVGLFKRYDPKETGRTLPGTKDGVYTCAGDEHNAVGQIIEDPEIRIEMVHRRLEKTKLIEKELPLPELIGPEDADLTIVSWGSNFGVISEAINILNKEEKKVNFLNIKYVLPFQKEAIKSLLSKAKKLLLIENNIVGQLGQLIAENTGIVIENKFLKYNGQTFNVNEIYQEAKRWLG
jgi:2-oxoglutarate/2-oxoacid ferredoxin oxidoreductase subunit alpha